MPWLPRPVPRPPDQATPTPCRFTARAPYPALCPLLAGLMYQVPLPNQQQAFLQRHALFLQVRSFMSVAYFFAWHALLLPGNAYCKFVQRYLYRYINYITALLAKNYHENIKRIVSFYFSSSKLVCIILNRSSRRKRGMASNPLFIIPDFLLHFPNELEKKWRSVCTNLQNLQNDQNRSEIFFFF